jgi:hypothetical protein
MFDAYLTKANYGSIPFVSTSPSKGDADKRSGWIAAWGSPNLNGETSSPLRCYRRLHLQGSTRIFLFTRE